MATATIIRPVLSEKSQDLSTNENKYVFVVEKTASKHQIRVAIEEQFDVKVESVNTIRMPAKLKSRYTKRGLQKGRRPAYKKAIVKLPLGSEIDFYAEDFGDDVNGEA